MAKDPAFLFYSQDFITGTLAMPFDEKGKYITLLCYQHQSGRMTEETIRFLIGSFSDNLKMKFKQDENGLFYNERLEKEIEKRNKFIESRIINGKMGGRPRDEIKPNGKPNGKPKKNLIENENNSIDNSNIIYTIYYDTELNSLNGDPRKEEYEKFIKFLFGDNELKTKLECWLKLDKQLSFDQYCKLREKAQKKNKKMVPMFLSGYNNPKYLKGKKTIYQTINTWLDRD